VLKGFAAQVLLKAIHKVMADGYWVQLQYASIVAQYQRDEQRRRKKLGLSSWIISGQLGI
jgi:hypothetical protein